jgi:predicted MFS family arabinose efflux permease
MILTIGVFGILNTEMGIVGILPLISEQFGVTVPKAGLLVSAFALVVAFAGPTMPLLFSKMNRKTVMVLALSIFTASNVISIFATDFNVLLWSRIIPAAFHPLYVSMALTVAGTSVERHLASKAVARVFFGVSAGMVVGVPITTLIATETSFSMAMVFFTVVNAAVLVATLLVVPSMPVTESLTYGSQIAVVKKPIMIVSFLTVIFLNGAVFGFYSYMSDFLGTVTQMSPRIISGILLVYGVANMVGNVIAGKLLTKDANKSVIAIPFALIITYLLLFVVGNLTIGTAIIVILIGILCGIMNNINQYIITEAGPEAPDFSNGLFLTAANLGTTFGTAVCGMFLTAINTRYTLFGSIIFLVITAILVIIRNSINKRVERKDLRSTLFIV